jgi:NADPH-dependent curcumin reductase CurA
MPHPHRALHLVARPGDGELKDDILELRTGTLPELGDGQLRVSVRYVSIDPAMRVWMTEAKSYWPPVELGAVMRAQAIGEVVESKHPKFPVGAWVIGMLGVQDGAVSDGKGLRAFDAKALPDPRWALSVFGATGMTAWFGLHDIGRIRNTDVVVVSAAAGAVGSAAVQIAKFHGCRVVGIAGGPEKCAYVRDTLGADEVIDYKAADVRRDGIGKAISAACPDGIDVYFDNVGGETLDAVLKRLRLKARIVLCGGISQYGAAEVRGPANYLSMISARARMEGFVVIDYVERTDEFVAGMAQVAATGKLTSKIDELEGLENYAEAVRRVLRGANFGKQLLKV